MKSVDDLNVLLGNTIEYLGFTQWAYQFKKDGATPFVVGDYPDEWVDHYLDSNYSDIDPIIIEGEKETMSFQWSNLTSRLTLDDVQSKFMNEATHFGLTDGIGIPIHYSTGKSAMLTMATNQKTTELNKLFEEHRSDIHLLALVYHQHLQDLMQQESFIEVKLTDREKEVLRWAALGKTAWETATILNISERTVNFHIENSRKKLSASSKQHAAIKAIMNKIIEI